MTANDSAFKRCVQNCLLNGSDPRLPASFEPVFDSDVRKDGINCQLRVLGNKIGTCFLKLYFQMKRIVAQCANRSERNARCETIWHVNLCVLSVNINALDKMGITKIYFSQRSKVCTEQEISDFD